MDESITKKYTADCACGSGKMYAACCGGKDACPCGSGKEVKDCCLAKFEEHKAM